MRILIKNEKKPESIGEMVRFWRQAKRVSQLDLALDIDISSKHLSFVETGRARPSRNLVLKIAQRLKMPLRQQNAFLLAAGYAPEFDQAPFDGQKMQMVREALHRIMEKHAPYPAFVVDTAYTILMKNSGYDHLVTIYAGENALKKHENAMRILFSEDGLRPYVVDWPAVEQFLLNRLWEEAAVTQHEGLMELCEEMSRLRTVTEIAAFQHAGNPPVMRLVLEKDTKRASFFTTIATLGTPLDVTTQELRIELLFPADEETKQLFPPA
ncbi:MAG: helix-turn-helix domain-containing protein [Thermodesulfobacteriota bacterium]